MKPRLKKPILPGLRHEVSPKFTSVNCILRIGAVPANPGLDVRDTVLCMYIPRMKEIALHAVPARDANNSSAAVQGQPEERNQSMKRCLRHPMRLKFRSLVGTLLPLSVVLFAVACLSSASASAQTIKSRPCDLYPSTTPCVAAFSTTRALYRKYSGALYQVTRQPDESRLDIGLLPDGYADAAAQDSFCAKASCTITKIYDQSPNHNDLTPAPPGGASRGPYSNDYDVPALADALPAMIDGHKVYGIAITHGMGYRNDKPAGTAVHGQPEGVYMVTSALNLNSRCCFDFGNAETNDMDNNAGHMDAINIMCRGEIPCGANAGLDMENGIYGHLKVTDGTAFVTAMGASDGQHTFAIYEGNAQSGKLTTTGAIPLPTGYQPMQQEGAIILGIGGDNSDWATGYFFEGVMTKGMPAAKEMEAVQKNIVAARYAAHVAGQDQP